MDKILLIDNRHLKARMRTKREILDEIRGTAKENGGKPLGAARFEQETGINAYEWTKFWARFGDAIQEAGFAPNQFQGAYGDEFLIEKIIALVRKLGKFPTYRELRVERAHDPELPDHKVFQRLGSKDQLARKVLDYCAGTGGYDDVTAFCEPVLKTSDINDRNRAAVSNEAISEVYLFKHGRYFKIGRTNDTVRRGAELRIQLPEKMHLIHSIKTDDPSGVEAYWHRRFELKRMNGEWFDLNPADVKAFQRWRRIV